MPASVPGRSSTPTGGGVPPFPDGFRPLLWLFGVGRQRRQARRPPSDGRTSRSPLRTSRRNLFGRTGGRAHSGPSLLRQPPLERGRVTGLKLRVRRARGRGWFPQRIRPACAPEDQAWTRGLAVSGLASGSPGDCPSGFLSEAARPWRSWARDGSGPPRGTRDWGHVSSDPLGPTPLGDREPGAGHSPRTLDGGGAP